MLSTLGALRQLQIERVMGSGLFALSDETHFNKYGCERCNWYHNRIMSAEVYDVEGFETLEDAKEGEKLVEVRLCGKCVNDLYYGTKPEDREG